MRIYLGGGYCFESAVGSGASCAICGRFDGRLTRRTVSILAHPRRPHRFDLPIHRRHADAERLAELVEAVEVLR